LTTLAISTWVLKTTYGTSEGHSGLPMADKGFCFDPTSAFVFGFRRNSLSIKTKASVARVDGAVHHSPPGPRMGIPDVDFDNQIREKLSSRESKCKPIRRLRHHTRCSDKKIQESSLFMMEFLVSPTTMELVLETKGLEGLESLDTKIPRNWVLGRLHSIISLSI
jgi:hypothetical protein